MIAVGQTVVLKSGGPAMVVTSCKDDGSGQRVAVLWYAKNNGRSQFNSAADLPASAFSEVANAAGPDVYGGEYARRPVGVAGPTLTKVPT